MENSYFGFLRFALNRLGLRDLWSPRGTDADGELSVLRLESFRRLEGRSHRAKITVEVFAADGSPASRTVALGEFAPPSSGAYISTTEAGGERTDYELIAVGERRYVRENGGAWRSDDSAPPTEFRLASYHSTVDFVGKSSSEGRAALVYREKRSGGTGDERTTSETRYWFTPDGELLEIEAEERNERTGETKRTVTVFEDDPNITIKAPVI